MYVLTKHEAKLAEWSQPDQLREVIGDLAPIMEHNAAARRIMAMKDAGRPGHYYGRDIVIEGEIPAAAFAVAPIEFDDDPDWWKNDAKFQAYMKRHPGYSWLNG